MATRIKTIEFATQTIITTLASATARSLTGTTQIYIPETGITFISCNLFVDCTGDNAATANLTVPTIQFRLGNNAFSSVTMGNPNAQSGENESWIFSRDVTSVMTSQWTGANMPWYLIVTFTGPATCNHAAKIIITYTYDDTSSPTSHIKTIRIPIESTRALLTTTLQTVGGATAIPGIKNFSASPYLPETGITIRQIFLELFGNSGQASATAANTIQASIAGLANVDVWRISAVGLNSGIWSHSLIDITNYVLTGATSLQMLSLTTTNRGVLYGGWINVTYEFNPSTSTIIYNSLLLGAADTDGYIGGTTAASQGTWQRTIYIEEPDTITQKESGVVMCFNDSGAFTFSLSCSGDTTGQAAQAYTVTAALNCGMYSLVHRIDSGGQNGVSGLGTLRRGQNLYTLKFFTGTADSGWNLSGLLILNYTSGKHADGYAAHSHSVYQHLIQPAYTVAGISILTGATIAPTVPESNYYIMGIVNYMNYNIAASADVNFTLNAEIVSTDPPRGGDGWERLYTGNGRTDSENMAGWNFSAARSSFTRWPGDPDTSRLNFLTSRKYRLDTNPISYTSVGLWYTYNSITFTVSGTCSGFAGDGSGIPVDIYRKAKIGAYDDLILQLTTTAGGTFTGKWADNTDTLYAVAKEDSTHIGRSADMSAG